MDTNMYQPAYKLHASYMISQAAVVKEVGDASVLKLVDWPVPKINDGQVCA